MKYLPDAPEIEDVDGTVSNWQHFPAARTELSGVEDMVFTLRFL